MQHLDRACALSISSLCKAALKTLPTLVWLNTDCSELQSPISTLHSFFLQVFKAVMLCPVHVQKVPQASKHVCPAKHLTSCNVCCACQSVSLFIPSGSSMARAVDPKYPLQPKIAWLCSCQDSPSQTPLFAARSLRKLEEADCKIYSGAPMVSQTM